MGSLTTLELVIVIVCSASGILALVASFVLRYAVEDGDQGSPGNLRYSFPPKEDKFARRNRWARVIGRGAAGLKSLAHLQKAAVVADPAQVSSDQLISFLLALDRQQQHQRTARAVQLAVVPVGASGGRSVSLQVLVKASGGPAAGQVAKPVYRRGASSETEDFSFWGLFSSGSKNATAGYVPLGEMFPSPPSPAEIQRIKVRIMRVLTEAGPAKALGPITEAHTVEKEQDMEPSLQLQDSVTPGRAGAGKVDLESGVAIQQEPAGNGKLLGRFQAWVGLSAHGERGYGQEGANLPLIDKTWGVTRKAAEAGDSLLSLDVEPVMMMGQAGVSREMLWRALALLGGQACVEEAAAMVRARWEALRPASCG